MEIIPCTQATFLISKREKHALPFREKFQLLIHLMICEFCRRFLEQTRIISKAAKSIIAEEKLTVEEKVKLKKMLGLT